MRTPPREADLSGIDREAALQAMRAARRRRARAAHGARGQGGACRIRHSHGADQRGGFSAKRWRRSRSPSSNRRRPSPSRCCRRTSTHKSDVGGVQLGLASPAEARAAAETMNDARGESAAGRAAPGLHRAADDRVAERARASARRVRRSPVWSGDPVRRRRHRHGDHQGLRRRPAAARRQACPRPHAADAHLQAARRLSRQANCRSRGNRRHACAPVAARGRLPCLTGTRHQSAARQ